MFIFLGGDPSHLSPEAQQAHMQKWYDWVKKLENEKGMLVAKRCFQEAKLLQDLKK